MLDATTQFCDAIRSAGLEVPGAIHADGNLHRFSATGKRGDDSGWYVMHDDGIPAGVFGDWRTGLMQSWRADIGRELTQAEKAAYKQQIEVMRKQRCSR